LTLPSRSFAAATLREHLERLLAVYDRREPFALLIDARQAPPFTATERQLIAEALRFGARRNPGVLRAVAICFANTAARAGFTAIHWLLRPNYPAAAFERIAAASVWLTHELGLPTSPHTGLRAAHRGRRELTS
jgi:hypothetical protein